MSSNKFMGISINERGPSDPRIKKALNKSAKLLDIMEFIKVTKFELNEVMFDYFWQIMIGNHGVHLPPMVLEWLGYEGEMKEQRKNFIRMLKRNDIDFEELKWEDENITLYPTIQEEMSTMAKCDVVKSKFLVMKPDDIKCAMMNLKTKKGDSIRRYYVSLEHLFKMYVEYTMYYNHRESQRKITSLEQMMADMKLEREEDRKYLRSLGISLEEVKDQNYTLIDETKGLKKQNESIQHKLGIAVEDRAPLPEDAKKQERFVLIRRNDSEYMPYYTIRAQHGYTQNKMKIERVNFPDLEVLLDFRCNPNSKTLYVRIKENLKAKGVTFRGNNIELCDSEVTEEEFVEEMKTINEKKYDV